MLFLLQLLFLSIQIDQETVLNWFGITRHKKQLNSYYFNDFSEISVGSSSNMSLDTLKIVIENFWSTFRNGLTLADIENLLFFILFVRFVILVFRYNLKTSFYITCIGLFAGYLWYRHLIDLISMYRHVLLKLPYLHKLGMDAIQLRSLHRQLLLTDLKLSENVRWNNPAQLIYYAFTKGITNVDSSTGFRYYIDPISMFVSNLNEPTKTKILPFYYKIYNQIIPRIFEVCSKLWAQISGVAAYALVTRIGKRYCPYLVRWHWTFLLIIGFVEQSLVYLIYRIYYFQTFILIPQINMYENYVNQNLVLQIDILNIIITGIVLLHMVFVIFGLFHAICGQYFYFPFFVENTELHIGPRPKNSIYSGGNTSWQNRDEKKKNFNRVFPKFWYGWFGRGTDKGFNFFKICLSIFKRFLKFLKRQFR